MIATFTISAIGHLLLVFLALGKWKPALLCGSFFLVQPVILAVERQLRVRRWRPAKAWLWTMGVLTITSPLFVEPILQIVEVDWSVPNFLPGAVAAMLFSVSFERHPVFGCAFGSADLRVKAGGFCSSLGIELFTLNVHPVLQSKWHGC